MVLHERLSNYDSHTESYSISLNKEYYLGTRNACLQVLATYEIESNG